MDGRSKADSQSGESDLSQFCCLNASCADCGKRGAGNLGVCGRIGKEGQWRLLRCRTCKARFSERKGTVFFRSRMPPQKVTSILGHVQEGVGMRKTGRLVGVKEDTVIRYARLAGTHAKDLHDELVAFSPSDRGGAAGREVVVRREEGEALRPCRRPARRAAG
jgi:LacI family transcriptional regulator